MKISVVGTGAWRRSLGHQRRYAGRTSAGTQRALLTRRETAG